MLLFPPLAHASEIRVPIDPKESHLMSCGVRYQFSLTAAPKRAEVIPEERPPIGTLHDAEEAGPADIRRADPGVAPPEPTVHGRQRQRT